MDLSDLSTQMPEHNAWVTQKQLLRKVHKRVGKQLSNVNDDIRAAQNILFGQETFTVPQEELSGSGSRAGQG